MNFGIEEYGEVLVIIACAAPIIGLFGWILSRISMIF